MTQCYGVKDRELVQEQVNQWNRIMSERGLKIRRKKLHVGGMKRKRTGGWHKIRWGDS